MSTSHKHARWHRRLAIFWFGPGMLISVALSFALGNIVSLVWVGLMSAYANGMMHYLESRQEQP